MINSLLLEKSGKLFSDFAKTKTNVHSFSQNKNENF